MADKLNGYNHNGHILSASADNHNNPVYIWEQKKSRSAGHPSSSASTRGAPTPNSSPYTRSAAGLAYGYYTDPAGGSASLDDFGACYSYDSGYSSRASSSSGYQYPPEPVSLTVTAMDPSSVQYGGAGNGTSSWYAHTQTQYPSGSGHIHQDAGYGYGYGGYGHGEEVPQTVKVIVKNLSRHASTKDLESYLLAAVGGRHMLQEDVRFPRKSSSSSSTSSSSSSSSSGRQHAFLLFNTHSDAVAAAGHLDKTELLGLTIEARLATEVVLPARGSPSSTASYMTPYGTSSSGSDATAIADPANINTGAGDLGSCDNNSSCTGSGSGSKGKDELKTKRDKSHNLVVDGKSVYGHVKKAVEESKTRDRKNKHRK